MAEDWSWKSKRVLVTGGASFIGSTLVEALLTRGAASVRIIDDFSSGAIANIRHLLEEGSVELIRGDLSDPAVSAKAVEGMDVLFHLAADHGGRGYVDLHQYACSTNLALDSFLFGAALRAVGALLRALRHGHRRCQATPSRRSHFLSPRFDSTR